VVANPSGLFRVSTMYVGEIVGLDMVYTRNSPDGFATTLEFEVLLL